VTTWINANRPAPVLTQTYAIGSLVDDKEQGHSSDEVIEAINLVWSTANRGESLQTGEDAPLVSVHEPSRLLIIKASAPLQSLASQVITNLSSAHQLRLQNRQLHDESAALREQFEREHAHLEQLHQITLERLKAAHASEIDRLQSAVAELETELRLVKSKLLEGGN
jgi:hypothetical protein